MMCWAAGSHRLGVLNLRVHAMVTTVHVRWCGGAAGCAGPATHAAVNIPFASEPHIMLVMA